MKKDIYEGSGVSTLEGIQNVLGILLVLVIIGSVLFAAFIAKSQLFFELKDLAFVAYFTLPVIVSLLFIIRIIQPLITVTKAAQCIVLEKEAALAAKLPGTPTATPDDPYYTGYEAVYGDHSKK